tara:strand:- start:1309 stop:1710 length:402 start_codon:yes stop_codon:yes gene_type:complete
MRATINFEIELERVSETMLALVKAETDSIRGAAHTIETTQPHQLEQKLTEAVDQLQRNVHQLEQYRSMLVSFARAKFETTHPPETIHTEASQEQLIKAQETLKTLQNMQQFDKFIDSINESSQPTEEGDDVKP